MKIKALSVIAAALLLAACETSGSGAGTQGGAGAIDPKTGRPMLGGTGANVALGPTQEYLVAQIGDRIFFDYDKYDLRADGKPIVDKQIAWAKQFPQMRLTIEGHCDERGTREYNLALGERRANTIRQYYLANGVAANRVKTVSYGKERPAVQGSNENAWAANRRGVTVVTN